MDMEEEAVSLAGSRMLLSLGSSTAWSIAYSNSPQASTLVNPTSGAH